MSTEFEDKDLESRIQEYESEIKVLQDEIAKQKQILSEEKAKETGVNQPNPNSNNYYHILGLSPTATNEEIRKAYKTCSTAYHPDRNNSPNANEQFRNVKEAYDNLADETKRKEYDASLNKVDYASINKEMMSNIAKIEESQKKKRELEIQLKNINKSSTQPRIISQSLLVNVTFAEKELKQFNGIKTDNTWMLRNSKGKTFTVTNREISAEGSDDATLNNIIDIYLACEKSKYAAAGKIAQFDITKLNPTAKGTDSARLQELCRRRGIGTALNQNKENVKPINENKEIITQENIMPIVRRVS
jgi:curved DNA-binding protein CbpA